MKLSDLTIGDKLNQVNRATGLATGEVWKVEKIFIRSIEVRRCSPTTSSLKRLFLKNPETGKITSDGVLYEMEFCYEF